MDRFRRRIEGRILPDPQPKTISLVWKLDSFYSLLPLGGSYLFYSPSFHFLNTEWWLVVSPTTTLEPGAPLHLVLGLHIQPKSARRSVFCKFGIRGSDGTEIVTASVKKEFVPETIVLEEVTSLSEQDRDLYLPGGHLTAFCNLWVERGETREAACWMEGPQGVQGLLRDLKSLFLNEEDADLTLNVGDRQFSAHKAILLARSSVFSAMLQHISERRSSTVEITDCDPETFGHFLAYLYSGTAEDLSKGNVLHLYRAADKYDVADLKAECVEFIKRNLSVDVFCDVAALALAHEEPELMQELTQFLANNLEAIEGSTAWHTFLQENPVAGRELYTVAQRHRGSGVLRPARTGSRDPIIKIFQLL